MQDRNPGTQSILNFLEGRQSEQYWFSGRWGLEWLGRKYKGLNHIVARDLIDGIKDGKISLAFASKEDATASAKSLIQYKISIPALAAAMREKRLSFSGEYFYEFLNELYKGYVTEPGLFTDEIMSRMGALTLLPYERGNNFTSEEENKYLLNPETPLEIVDILIQKPHDMSFERYSYFIQSIIENRDNSQRKTEIILLAIKNLTNYEIAYSDEKPVERPEISSQAGEVVIDDINFSQELARNPQVEPSNHNGEVSQRAADSKLKLALARGGLSGTKYEKHIATAMESHNARTKAEKEKIANYLIYKARQDVKVVIVNQAEKLRTLLFVQHSFNFDFFDLSKIISFNINFDFFDLSKIISFDIKLKTLANSGRCRRIVKKIIMAELKKEGNVDKFTDARKAVAGYKNLDSIARMVALTDQETFKLIGEIMNDAIAEIEAEYNFNPNFWRGTISRGWSTFASYPIGAFFAVLDFFSLIFEYVVEYSKRAGCKSYEAVRRWLSYYDTQPRQNQEILDRKDVERALGCLKNLLTIGNRTQLVEIGASPEEKLRNAIIDFLADESKAEALKKALSDFPEIQQDSPLQQAVEKLKGLEDDKLKDHKKDLQAILDMAEMHRGVSDALPSWSRYAKAMEVFRQYSPAQAHNQK